MGYFPKIFVEILAGRPESAFLTARRSCYTDIAAMQDQPVMCLVDEFLGYILHQLLFHGEWRGSAGAYQAYALAYPEHMRVYGHVRLHVYHRSDHICGLPADAG